MKHSICPPSSRNRPSVMPPYYDDLDYSRALSSRLVSGGYDDLAGAGLIPVNADRLLGNGGSIGGPGGSLADAGGLWDFPLRQSPPAKPLGAGAYLTSQQSQQVQQQYHLQSQQSQQAPMYGMSGSTGYDMSGVAAANAQQLAYGSSAAPGSGTAPSSSSVYGYYSYAPPHM
eukprot:c11347_g3_i1.p1 GENE.c11347_g3_i1~~c11347_g3_i1.p1  ORF type:complete len:172 (+),score=34.60 c11347_g3_i1:340-855(+)